MMETLVMSAEQVANVPEQSNSMTLLALHHALELWQMLKPREQHLDDDEDE
jgi:hypothetical protein